MVTAPDWFAAPMLCKTKLRDDLDIVENWSEYVAEPKHDGWRCLVDTRDGSPKLYSRTGQDLTDHVHIDLLAELSEWLPKDTIIDGELAIIDRTITVHGVSVPVSNFNSTQRILGSGAERGRGLQPELGIMSLIAYDLLRWDGINYDNDRLVDRRGDLEIDFPHSERLVLNPQYTDHTQFGDVFDALIDNGVEGIIAKNKGSVYVFEGRPNLTWYKVKVATTLDMIITGYTEGKGKYEGLIGAIEFGRWTDDGIVFVARCSGLTDDLRRQISADKDAYIGKVIEVKSNDLVGSGSYRTPRHPNFVTFRHDKNPQDCLGTELKNGD